VKIKFLADASLNRAIVNRVLVTHDIKTMPFHFAQLLTTAEIPGVILISQKTSVAEAIESLVLVWLASEPAEWVNRICQLPF
jgi:hypothetical protein